MYQIRPINAVTAWRFLILAFIFVSLGPAVMLASIFVSVAIFYYETTSHNFIHTLTMANVSKQQ